MSDETTEERVRRRFDEVVRETSLRVDMAGSGQVRGPHEVFPDEQARALAIAQAVSETSLMSIMAEEIERLREEMRAIAKGAAEQARSKGPVRYR